MQQANLKGMEAKLYRSALSGSFEGVSSIANWKEQETPTKNNVLHVHVGKPLNKKAKDSIRSGMVNIEFIEDILKDDDAAVSLLFKENSSGDTPLHLASRFGHDKAVQAFLERARQINEEVVLRMLRIVNKKKDTALNEAARAGHAAVVDLLVVVEADSNCSHEPNEEGETPLYLAAESGCTSSVLSILETCNAFYLSDHYKGPCGRTALHAAVQWGSRDMVFRILEKDRSVINIQDNEGLTPIHCAAAEIWKSELLKILLQYDNKECSAVYIQDNTGRTALHIAVLRYNLSAMKEIIASCPDCIEIVDNNGQNVLHYAAKWTCLVKFRRIFSIGTFDKLINEKDLEGNTPLHLFASLLPRSPYQQVDPSVNCLLSFVKNNPFVSLKAFNKQNLTVGDIMVTYDSLLRQEHILGPRCKITPRGRRINTYERDVDIEKVLSVGTRGEYNVPSLKKAAESRLVVAALISTVSFAAGFGVPGGVDQNAGKNMGTAVFESKTSFKVFMVADVMAFTSSMIAILLYFVLASTDTKWAIQGLSLGGLILNTFSLGALMIAFLAGVCAILSKSQGLVITISLISAAFFSFFCGLIYRNFRTARFFFRRYDARSHRVLQ